MVFVTFRPAGARAVPSRADHSALPDRSAAFGGARAGEHATRDLLRGRHLAERRPSWSSAAASCSYAGAIAAISGRASV